MYNFFKNIKISRYSDFLFLIEIEITVHYIFENQMNLRVCDFNSLNFVGFSGLISSFWIDKMSIFIFHNFYLNL